MFLGKAEKRDIFQGLFILSCRKLSPNFYVKLARLIAVYMGNVHSENLKFQDNKFELN